jgi:integrase
VAKILHFKTKESVGMTNFIDFVNTEGPNIWRGKHLAESRAKLHRFGAFEGVGFKPLLDITARDIHSFCIYLKGTGITENTVNHYRAAISSILKHALDLEEIDRMPKIKFARIRTNRVRYLTDEEIQQLDDFLKTYKEGTFWWMRYMCQVALATGMRLGELLSITPDRVSMHADGVCIVHLTNTKNGDDRDVVCAGRTFRALKALKFDIKGHYSHRKFYHAWEEARYQIAKGDKEFVFHVLRHTAATRMANNLKLPTVTVAQQLGHRSLQTTAKYVHQTPENQLAIARLMGEI